MFLPVRLVAGDRSTMFGVTPLFIQQTLVRGSVFAIVFESFSRIKNARPGGEGSDVGLRRQSDRQHYVLSRHRTRAVVFKCLTYSTFDDVTYDVILPLGWAGSNLFS